MFIILLLPRETLELNQRKLLLRSNVTVHSDKYNSKISIRSDARSCPCSHRKGVTVVEIRCDDVLVHRVDLVEPEIVIGKLWIIDTWTVVILRSCAYVSRRFRICLRKVNVIRAQNNQKVFNLYKSNAAFRKERMLNHNYWKISHKCLTMYSSQKNVIILQHLLKPFSFLFCCIWHEIKLWSYIEKVCVCKCLLALKNFPSLV